MLTCLVQEEGYGLEDKMMESDCQKDAGLLGRWVNFISCLDAKWRIM